MIIKAQIMAVLTLSGLKERARQQYNSCIAMYINVAKIPRIIKAQIRGYQYVEWPKREKET